MGPRRAQLIGGKWVEKECCRLCHPSSAIRSDLHSIAAGVANHRGTQLVLSIGDRLDPKQIGPVPSNVIIVNQAPQLELLKRASVCITHAGLNTVLESLAQGVPQPAIPVTFEQLGIAANIVKRCFGVVQESAC